MLCLDQRGVTVVVDLGPILADAKMRGAVLRERELNGDLEAQRPTLGRAERRFRPVERADANRHLAFPWRPSAPLGTAIIRRRWRISRIPHGPMPSGMVQHVRAHT